MKLYQKLTTICFLALTLNADQIQLQEGWNLIGINSTDSASSLTANTNILKATGGGVGGGGDFRYDKEFSQYASGNIKQGQGYWIKANTTTSLTYNKSTQNLSSIELLEGWNLINPCIEIDASQILTKYPNVVKATGGGVGGGGDFRYDREFAQYATGITKDTQGYWFKSDSSFSITCISPFEYRAWGMGGDDVNSKLTVMVNGINYTLVSYSKLNIEQSNASTQPDTTVFTGILNQKNITNSFSISNDYNTHEVVIKVFNNDTDFTNDTFLIQSEAIVANNSYLTYNINIDNPDDYRPIQPIDNNIEMPPMAPVF